MNLNEFLSKGASAVSPVILSEHKIRSVLNNLIGRHDAVTNYTAPNQTFRPAFCRLFAAAWCSHGNKRGFHVWLRGAVVSMNTPRG